MDLNRTDAHMGDVHFEAVPCHFTVDPNGGQPYFDGQIQQMPYSNEVGQLVPWSAGTAEGLRPAWATEVMDENGYVKKY